MLIRLIYSRRFCYVNLVLSFHFHFTSFILPPEKTYSGGALVSLACDFLQRKNARISRIPAQQQQSTITIVPTKRRYCHQAQFSKQKNRDVHPASVNLATDTRTIRNNSRVASDIMKTIFQVNDFWDIHKYIFWYINMDFLLVFFKDVDYRLHI